MALMISTHLLLDRNADIYYPFAYEEELCREAGEGRLSVPAMHIWRHERAVVLGLRDSRLPGARDAMEWLADLGYSVMVRNSGGAAVPLDEGVVNVTVVQSGVPGHLNMDGDFRRMAELLASSLAPFGVAFDIGEVAGSYCPGKYDLSIGGRKFCGLAQRRRLRAFAVQAFVNVEGRSRDRAELIREFYRRAGGVAWSGPPGAAPSGGRYDNAGPRNAAGAPDVGAGTMGSLTELHPGFPGAKAWVESLMERFGGGVLASPSLSPSSWPAPPSLSAERIHGTVRALKERYDPRF